MNIIKTSIASIIFTILLFIFIVFISLFKGLTLYNINFQNFSIKKVFIKIDKKIILKANVKLKRSNKKVNLYSIIKFLELLSYFKKIDINGKNLNVSYFNKYLKIKIPNLSLNAYVQKSFFTTIIINKLIYKQLSIKKIILNIKNYLNNIFINGEIINNNTHLNFNGKIYIFSNKLNLKLKSKKFLYTLNNLKLIFNNLSSNITIKLDKFKINSKLNTKSLIVDFNKTKIKLYDLNCSQNNNKISLTAKKSLIKFNNINNITLLKIKAKTNLKDFYTYINSSKIYFKYKNFNFDLNDTNISIINKNKFLIKIKSAKINNKSITYILEKIFIVKNKKNFFFNINSSKFISKKIKAYSSKIKGNDKVILNDLINGIFDSFKFNIKNNKFILNNKIFLSKQINLNNTKINNLKIDFNKNFATFTSKTYFNSNINNILKKELNISIPITQLNGENNITGIVNFEKNISFNIKVFSKNPILKLINMPLQAKEANITITKNFTTFNINKSYLEIMPKINLFFSGFGKVNYEPLTLKLKGIIENFVIYPILNVKKFKEQAKMDLNSLELFLKNSHVYINLNKKNIIVNNLKTILPFTPFKKLINKGILYISFKDNIKAFIYIKPALNIFYRHNNEPVINLSNLDINKIMLNIELNKDKIILYNNYIQFFMNKNNIFLSLKNIDINLFPLEKVYYKYIKQNNMLNRKIVINLNDSNILYKNHKILSQKAEIKEINNSIFLKSIYKKSSIKGFTKLKYFLLEGKNFSKEEINAFLPKLNFFKKINIDFTLVKSPDDYYIGNIHINHAVISKLKALNNVMAFLNTIPSLLSLSSPGFSDKGYKIKEGDIQYILYKKILYIKKSLIKGNNIDFISKGYIDLNKNYIHLKTKAILKLKLKKIPIIGKGLSYLFFGKNGNIEVNIIIKGNLYNPKIKKNIGKALIPNPFTLFKRVLTLPFNLF